MEGEEQFLGLSGPILIARDKYGIPHIYTQDEDDLFFGQGYAAAQDRLWQMDLWRRAAAGRLAEVLGNRQIRGRRSAASSGLADLVGLDLFHRALNFVEVAEAEGRLLDPSARRVLERYRDGVNACREEAFREGWPSPEFLILGYLPEPWRIEDSLAIGKLIGWMLSIAWQAKLVLGSLAADDVLKGLLPGYTAPGKAVPVVSHSPSEINIEARMTPGLEGQGYNSNSWAVDGAKSLSGKPLLANDPHLPMGLPPFWHLVHLEGGAYHVAGASLPCLPGVLIGRNQRIAWGLTATMADDAELYREALHPDGGSYSFKGQWRPLKMRAEEIRVKGEGGPRRFTIRFVPHGEMDCPLISDLLSNEGEEGLSLRWTGLEPNRGLEALLALNRAQDWPGFREALSLFAVPTQNFLFADRAGNIGYQCAGRIPLRPRGEGAWGPLDGASGEGEWEGYIPFPELPYLYNPPGHFLANANNRIVGNDYPYHISHYWEPHYRVARLGGLLMAKEKFRAEDFQGMQADVRSLQAETLIAALIEPLMLQGGLSGRAREGAELLLDWDGECRAESPEAALFHVFYDVLLKGVFKRGMDRRKEGLFQRYFSLLHIPLETIDRLLMEGDPYWFHEKRQELIASSLEEAMDFLERGFGLDRGDWAWGKIHSLTLRHPLGQGSGRAQRLISWLFQLNLGPYPCPGDGMTPNLGAYLLTEPFQVTMGPSYRQVVDLGDPGGFGVVLPGGNAGHPLSPHYRDQDALWRRGGYIRLDLLPREEVPPEWKHLWLRPKGRESIAEGQKSY